jgi:rod shape-determining protein MreC
MVKGLSAEVCKLDYVVKSSDVEIGDIVVTSGQVGIFPKGLPVGRVLSVKDISGELFKDIEIRPVVDFSKLEEVLVILEEDKAL